MPTKDQDLQEQILTILDDALQASPGQHANIVNEWCASDPTLKNEVMSRLDAHKKMGDFADRPVSEKVIELLIESEFETKLLQNPKNNEADKIKRYNIIGELGKGGMGLVRLAYDTVLKREVALKQLSAHLISEPGFVERFKREAQIAANFNHPNIVKVNDAWQEDGCYYIDTEFVDGLTIENIIKVGIRIVLSQGLHIIAQVAGALEALHKESIVHRDVKPSNIMVRYDGIVKVLDFGIAKQVDKQSSENLTVNGTIIGTSLYMSPEQSRGDKVDTRSDIFSLGVVLYEIITGCAPFSGSTSYEIRGQINYSTPAQLVEQVGNLPMKLQSIVDKALAKDPADRYQSVSELRSELESLKQEIEQREKNEFIQPEPDLINRPASTHNLRSDSLFLGKLVFSFCRNHSWIFVALLLFALASGYVAYKFIYPSTILTLAGSDTIGSELMLSLVEGFFRDHGSFHSRGGETHKVVGGVEYKSVSVRGIFKGDVFPRQIVVTTHGTEQGFKDLEASAMDIEGAIACDIAMASHQIPPEIQYRLEIEHPITDSMIGHDGVAVIINNRNEISELTVEQVSRIFRQEIKYWSDLGLSGVNAPRCGRINTYIRNKESGTREFVKQVLLSGYEFVVSDPTQEINNNRLLAEKVGSDPCGIGFVPAPFVSWAKPITLLENGKRHILEPFNIASNDYLLTRRLYFYFFSDSQNAWVKKFNTFCLSEKGQSLIDGAHFVNIVTQLKQVAPSPNAPDGYKQLTKEADKLSLYVPFQINESKLSPHARYIIKLAVEFLSRREYEDRVVVVVGHGDDIGDNSKTKRLSWDRAQAVAKELQKARISLEDPQAYGNEVPAVVYQKGEDQEKNRRVELWLRRP